MEKERFLSVFNVLKYNNWRERKGICSLQSANKNAKCHFPVQFGLKSTCFMVIMGSGTRI